MKKFIFAVTILMFSQFASAVSLNYNGTLLNEGDFATFQFNVSAPSSVDIWTDSFNPGFDAILGLYDSLGNQVSWNDDNGSTFGGANPGLNHVLQDSWDSSIYMTNLVGNYILAVSNFSSQNWSDHQQNKPLADMFSSTNTNSFVAETGDYNIYISGDKVSAVTNTVPEPGIISLMFLGLAGFYMTSKKSNFQLKRVVN